MNHLIRACTFCLCAGPDLFAGEEMALADPHHLHLLPLSVGLSDTGWACVSSAALHESVYVICVVCACLGLHGTCVV